MSCELILTGHLPPCSKDDLKVMDEVIERVKQLPEIEIKIDHFIHAGLYVRTCFIPAGCVIVGALIKVPTVVEVSGKCKVTVGAMTKLIEGYVVLKAEAGRRQAFLAIEDTYVTMTFSTKAKTVKDAEKEMTDEYELLTTNNGVRR